MKNKITIATHNSKFHADDIFAVATLYLLLENEYEISVVRTRDQNIINASDYVLDVGDLYDPDKNRFDHHQVGRAGKRENGILYASFGLVWKKFGAELCGSKEISDEVDQSLVQGIDAIDNGIGISEAVYQDVYIYDIGDFFDSLTPTWKEDMNNIDGIFMEAVSFAKNILRREIKKQKDKLEAKDIVINIYNQSSDKRIIVFEKNYPADEFLSKFSEPVFTISPKSDGTWIVSSINYEKYSFKSRKLLPESWAGKHNEEFEKTSGVKGSIFCHCGRFIAVAQTKEAAIKLAEIALNS